ncbi:MAG: BatA domain-containing protein [Pirellulales bacterium]|nr:BatA domain-containing protein [Pirellulales bacterium]
MTFVTPLLLAGAALIAIPIILHLIMRRKPKWLEFPALRFVQKRHDKNKRSVRLRHIILLLLRAGIIAFLAFALARPTVQLGGSWGSQEAPVAAGIVFDTAPHVGYRHENQTRLETAKKLGAWLLSQLPENSEIAVLDTHSGGGAFQVDRGAAKQRIERLEVVPNSQPLVAAVEEAIRLLKEDSKLPRKELYIFTDLSRGSWPAGRAAQLHDRLAALPGAGIYVIDVGVKNPIDFALGEIRLSAEVLSNRGSLTIAADLSALGGSGERAVELYLLDADGNPQPGGVQSATLAPGETRPIEFHKASFPLGTHQGFLRIVGQDGLAADDTRYFTVEAKPAWQILLAAPQPAADKAFFLSQALAPAGYRKRGQARFDCEVIPFDELSQAKLSDYAAVCLLDPPPLDPAIWQTLAGYASDGHGVGVFLGRNALAQSLDKFNNPQALELLPGPLRQQVPRPDGDVYLAPKDLQHPILAPFRAKSGEVPWEMFPVLRYWELGKLAAGVGTVMAYNDGRPALLERPIGSGRSLTMTTPVSDDPNRNPWNLLPVNDAWPFVILANQIASYLVGSSTEQLNYLAGQTAVLGLDPKEQRTSFLLTAPDGQSYPLLADLQHRRLVVSSTDLPGNYRIRAGGKEGGFDRGFSVNLAVEQTQLERLGEKELKEIFEPHKINLAQTKEQIDRSVIKTRVGRELFPPLIFLVAVILALELVVSNRFYRE